MTDAWDAKTGTLLFVRNLDHRLYAFDPSSSTFSIVSDLPVTTTYVTRIAVDGKGSVVVNGSLRGAKDFTPTGVALPGKELLRGVLAACGGPSGFLTVDAAGAVRRDTHLVGRVGFALASDLPLTCDTLGNAFTAGTVISPHASSASITVYRFAADGSVSTLAIPLRAETVDSRLPGASPVRTWVGPDLQALLPDGRGGVWVVSFSGTNDLGLKVGFPTLRHAVFAD